LTGLLVGVAGVVAALAAIPPTAYRTVVLIAGGTLLVLALLITVRSLRRRKPTFTIATPRPGQTFNGGGEGIIVSGTAPNLGTDALWIVEDGLIGEGLVWFVLGELLVDDNEWSFDYEPTPGQSGRTRRTLSIVRADRQGKRQLRGVRRDAEGRQVVYDPAPGGCEVLGQVSMYLIAQP
jgi:hypothetical protein